MQQRLRQGWAVELVKAATGGLARAWAAPGHRHGGKRIAIHDHISWTIIMSQLPRLRRSAPCALLLACNARPCTAYGISAHMPPSGCMACASRQGILAAHAAASPYSPLFSTASLRWHQRIDLKVPQ